MNVGDRVRITGGYYDGLAGVLVSTTSLLAYVEIDDERPASASFARSPILPVSPAYLSPEARR